MWTVSWSRGRRPAGTTPRRAARAAGAAGIQVGTLFGYTDESGLTEPLKRSVLEHATRGDVEVFTDPRASPTGYPFKVVRWPADPAMATEPRRRIGYRCPAEPVDAYVQKGGALEDTVGRRCLCNALVANVGHAQLREDGRAEPVLLTSGDDLTLLREFLRGRASYSAGDVLDYLAG